MSKEDLLLTDEEDREIYKHELMYYLCDCLSFVDIRATHILDNILYDWYPKAQLAKFKGRSRPELRGRHPRCTFPDKKCPSMERGGQCLLRNPYDCPLAEKVVSRPELEKIAKLIWCEGQGDIGWETSWNCVHKEGICYTIADQILSLLDGEIEAVEGRWVSVLKEHDITVDSPESLVEMVKVLVEEAKREERERILSYLKNLANSNPKASLSATIDLIEATNPAVYSKPSKGNQR